MLFVHEFLSHLILFFHYEAEVLTLIVTLMIIFMSRELIGSSIDFCFEYNTDTHSIYASTYVYDLIRFR